MRQPKPCKTKRSWWLARATDQYLSHATRAWFVTIGVFVLPWVSHFEQTGKLSHTQMTGLIWLVCVCRSIRSALRRKSIVWKLSARVLPRPHWCVNLQQLLLSWVSSLIRIKSMPKRPACFRFFSFKWRVMQPWLWLQRIQLHQQCLPAMELRWLSEPANWEQKHSIKKKNLTTYRGAVFIVTKQNHKKNFQIKLFIKIQTRLKRPKIKTNNLE